MDYYSLQLWREMLFQMIFHPLVSVVNVLDKTSVFAESMERNDVTFVCAKVDVTTHSIRHLSKKHSQRKESLRSETLEKQHVLIFIIVFVTTHS